MKVKLSVVLATRNEEKNISSCLNSVKEIADEIIVFDEFSEDKTREIAKSFGAKVFKYQHKTNFHETKQKAIEKATGDWILQLDADERVTPELSEEIKTVINLPTQKLKERVLDARSIGKFNNPKKISLFIRHQKLLGLAKEKSSGSTKEVVAFFVPRKNYFLGKPLIHAGVYPDASIRLIRKGKARLPAKSVHEMMKVDGEIGWLFNDLEHHESPTFFRYLERANRYTDLTAQEFKKNYGSKKSLILLFYFSFIKPLIVFLNLYILHKGFLDGVRGFIWSLFSGLHYPIAYFKFWQMANRD